MLLGKVIHNGCGRAREGRSGNALVAQQSADGLVLSCASVHTQYLPITTRFPAVCVCVRSLRAFHPMALLPLNARPDAPPETSASISSTLYITPWQRPLYSRPCSNCTNSLVPISPFTLSVGAAFNLVIKCVLIGPSDDH